jgi:hypothetical protein
MRAAIGPVALFLGSSSPSYFRGAGATTPRPLASTSSRGSCFRISESTTSCLVQLANRLANLDSSWAGVSRRETPPGGWGRVLRSHSLPVCPGLRSTWRGGRLSSGSKSRVAGRRPRFSWTLTGTSCPQRAVGSRTFWRPQTAPPRPLSRIASKPLPPATPKLQHRRAVPRVPLPPPAPGPRSCT